MAKIEVCKDAHGMIAIYINDLRVTGRETKLYGSFRALYSFDVLDADVNNALGPDLNIHEEIEELLSQGHVVKSCAVGRIGNILRIEDGMAVIKLRGKTNGVTTFLRGDEVAVFLENDGTYSVRNII